MEKSTKVSGVKTSLEALLLLLHFAIREIPSPVHLRTICARTSATLLSNSQHQTKGLYQVNVFQ